MTLHAFDYHTYYGTPLEAFSGYAFLRLSLCRIGESVHIMSRHFTRLITNAFKTHSAMRRQELSAADNAQRATISFAYRRPSSENGANSADNIAADGVADAAKCRCTATSLCHRPSSARHAPRRDGGGRGHYAMAHAAARQALFCRRASTPDDAAIKTALARARR